MFSTLLISLAIAGQCPNCTRSVTVSPPLSETVKMEAAGFRGVECTNFIFPTEEFTAKVIEEMRKDRYNNIETGDKKFYDSWVIWKNNSIKAKSFLGVNGKEAQRIFGYIMKVSSRDYLTNLDTLEAISDQ